jgi:uncharacterized membrane protein
VIFSILILICAFNSAVWNIHVKQAVDKISFAALMVIPQIIISFPLMFLVPLPSTHSFIYILLSSFIQTAYILFVTQAYHHGLMNRVYPLAVGFAPLISLATWHFFWGSPISYAQYGGVVILSFGIIGFTFIEKHPLKGINTKALFYALGSSIFIFGYSLVDTLGIRTVTNPLTYISWLFTIKGLILFLPIFFLYQKMNYRFIFNKAKSYLIAGLLAGFGYSVAIWAFLYSPTAVILALRSTSVVFVFILSVLVLKEPASISGHERYLFNFNLNNVNKKIFKLHSILILS